MNDNHRNYANRSSDYYCVGHRPTDLVEAGIFFDEPHCCYDSVNAGKNAMIGSQNYHSQADIYYSGWVDEFQIGGPFDNSAPNSVGIFFDYPRAGVKASRIGSSHTYYLGEPTSSYGYNFREGMVTGGAVNNSNTWLQGIGLYSSCASHTYRSVGSPIHDEIYITYSEYT